MKFLRLKKADKNVIDFVDSEGHNHTLILSVEKSSKHPYKLKHLIDDKVVGFENADFESDIKQSIQHIKNTYDTNKKKAAIQQPNKPKPTTTLPDNMEWSWDPNAADWVAVMKNNTNVTPPLYNPQNQNIVNQNTTSYMSTVKSSNNYTDEATPEYESRVREAYKQLAGMIEETDILADYAKRSGDLRLFDAYLQLGREVANEWDVKPEAVFGEMVLSSPELPQKLADIDKENFNKENEEWLKKHKNSSKNVKSSFNEEDLSNIWVVDMWLDNMDSKDGHDTIEFTKIGLIDFLNNEIEEYNSVNGSNTELLPENATNKEVEEELYNYFEGKVVAIKPYIEKSANKKVASDTKQIGRWLLKVVKNGETTNRGNGDFTNKGKGDGDAYDIVEIYDTKQDKNKFTQYGQFVSSYYVSTFLDIKNGLNMQGDVPEWTMSASEVKEAQEWLKSLYPNGTPRDFLDDAMEEFRRNMKSASKKVKSEKSMMELAQNIIYDVVLIHKAKSMDERPEWDGTFAILTLNPEKTDIVDIKYIPQSSLPSYTPNDNEYGLVRTRDTGFDETDYQLQPLEMIIRQRKSDSFSKDDKNAIEIGYKKQSSCLAKFLDGPQYSKEIKIEAGLIKNDLVKYAGFDFNKGTKYAITTKGLEVLRKASEAEHNEALNEREKLAYMFGFNTDKETTLDTTGKVIKSDELSKCEWCGEEFDESELEDTELGKVCYRCKKGIESKEGPMNNKNISEAKQYLEKYLLENPELFKYQYGKDNVEEVLKELIEENPNWYKKFSSKKWTICEADGSELGKVTASSELDAKVKFGIEHPEYADSLSICAKEVVSQYEQTTEQHLDYPNPSETPVTDTVIENHTGWVNTADQKVTPQFAKLHNLLSKYSREELIEVSDLDENLVVTGDPQLINQLEHEVKDIGYHCEAVDESLGGDYAPTYSLKIFMK